MPTRAKYNRRPNKFETLLEIRILLTSITSSTTSHTELSNISWLCQSLNNLYTQKPPIYNEEPPSSCRVMLVVIQNRNLRMLLFLPACITFNATCLTSTIIQDYQLSQIIHPTSVFKISLRLFSNTSHTHRFQALQNSLSLTSKQSHDRYPILPYLNHQLKRTYS
jgi:hypothetical protein